MIPEILKKALFDEIKQTSLMSEEYFIFWFLITYIRLRAIKVDSATIINAINFYLIIKNYESNFFGSGIIISKPVCSL